MSLASWYSSRCNCLQTDVVTFSTIQSKHEFYLPTKCEVKTVGVNINDYLKTVPKHKLSYINFSNSAAESDKEIIAKQTVAIKQLEDKCAHLQAELHKSKDLYLYSSLKYLLANKEHREEIMKTHKENTHDLKKKLTKLSASS